MKEESVLNVLMYLFKNHMQDNCNLESEEPDLLLQLEEIGFRRKVIDRAFTWLDNLTENSQAPQLFENQKSFRVFHPHEQELFDADSRRFLQTLEAQGILKPHTRELVINQAMELEAEGIDVNLLKWVTLMVLFNQPDEKHALACMELLVLDDTTGVIH